jgi:hypothetical protein
MLLLLIILKLKLVALAFIVNNAFNKANAWALAFNILLSLEREQVELPQEAAKRSTKLMALEAL